MEYKFICDHCKRESSKHPRQQAKYKKRKHEFCSKECSKLFKTTAITKPCGWCNSPTTRVRAEFESSKSGLIFCSKSCACSYNNTRKRKSRRSKCEDLLFTLLEEKYPNFEIIPNDKELLDGYEVDISIPELKLAIEWNGIVHFKPIYGKQKLQKIQSRDAEKLKIANDKNINLIVIPDLVSKEAYVKEAFYNICRIIDTL